MKVLKDSIATHLHDEKTMLIAEIKEAIHNLKLVREGKLKAKPAKKLLSEL